MANILSARDYAKNLLDFISRAAKRRIEWRGDWRRQGPDGEWIIVRMDDQVGDLIEQYVQARIAEADHVADPCGFRGCGYPEDSANPHSPCIENVGGFCGTQRCHSFVAASVARGEEEPKR